MEIPVVFLSHGTEYIISNDEVVTAIYVGYGRLPVVMSLMSDI